MSSGQTAAYAMRLNCVCGRVAELFAADAEAAVFTGNCMDLLAEIPDRFSSS